jgi:hypothetical protein
LVIGRRSRIVHIRHSSIESRLIVQLQKHRDRLFLFRRDAPMIGRQR